MFIPPHCPNTQCPTRHHPPNGRWFQKTGQYHTKTFGFVPRFRCKHCSKGFSQQTFSINYFAKRKLNYSDISNKINAGAGIRAIARQLKVRPKAITNRINRLGRNATLLNQQIADTIGIGEDMVIDGLENFCVSQFFPDNATVTVGKDSQFVYECDYATLRRKGRMTPAQKQKRTRLEESHFKAEPGALKQSFSRLLESIDHRMGDREMPLILYTDEKSDYKRALWNTKRFRDILFSGRWRHHPTSSKEPRTLWNPLFPVNYMDREIRKDMASHARETVQFPRNVSNLMLRLNLYLFDHNVGKPYRINDPAGCSRRHAQEAGMRREHLDSIYEDLFTKRVFMKKGQRLSPSALRTLNRQWVTPLKKRPEKLWKYLRP